MAGNGNGDLEKQLWAAADQLWANSALKPSEYSSPVLGLIFLRFADFKFGLIEKELTGKGTGRRAIGKTDYHSRGIIYLPKDARFSIVLNLPESANIGEAVNTAMKLIEADNPNLTGALPKNYQRIPNSTLTELLKIMSSIRMDIEGDAFGKIYEYFLGEFAKKEGQKGGEFFTPTSLVKLIVEVLEPYHGKIFDPASGSGGMFVQSAKFVTSHKKDPNAEISIYGQERVQETIRLCRMNLAVHGLEGTIREGNTYYEDIHNCRGQFDFVMANPPFNVSGVDKERLNDDKRFPFGMPNTDNANYLWIQLFYAALGAKGRAGFVMANSAADARGTEMEVRKQIINAGAVDVMISIGSNFFYTVTLPCTLWFFNKSKPAALKDKVLFIDARHIFTQIDRAHRDFSSEQTEFLANIVRLYRGETPEFAHKSEAMLKEKFPKGKYVDVAGLCKIASRKEIEEHGWSLNPGRYVGVTERAADDFVFAERLEELNEELETLNVEAKILEEHISENVAKLIEGAI